MMEKTIGKDDVHYHTVRVYYIYCPHCGDEIDDHDVGLSGHITCPNCDESIFVEE